MVEERNDEILGKDSIDKGNLEAAIEFGRLLAEETCICHEELGQVVWRVYHGLQGGEYE